MDQSISVLSVAGLYFSFFFSNFERKFCKQTVETLIWVCTVFTYPTKRMLGLNGLKVLDGLGYIKRRGDFQCQNANIRNNFTS